jgi:hypothetical protein
VVVEDEVWRLLKVVGDEGGGEKLLEMEEELVRVEEVVEEIS